MKTLFIALFLSSFSLLFADELKIGSPTPAVKGVSDTNEKVDLKDITSKNTFVLVYFYPKADTPGCTAQACSLRDAYEVLQKKGVKIFGVSSDLVADQAAFKKKYHLPFTLIADTDGAWAKAFGVSMTGKFMSREAFLIYQGKIHWLDRTASTKEQANDVLAVLKGMQ